jgi:ribosomal 50S subunit-recycling heat shock protein
VKRTKSEKLFEEILERKQIKFNRILEELRKQIDQGKVLTLDIHSKGLENQIKKAKKQFRGYRVENQPYIIVIADCRDFFFKDFNILLSLKA